jgi:predicted Zn-dependent peptidase
MQGPTADQMKKATASLQYSQYAQLESMIGKAQNLASGYIYYGDPGYSAKNVAKLMAVTPAQVKAMANKYLGVNRIVLSAVPNGKKNLASHAAESVSVTSPFASKQEVGQ